MALEIVDTATSGTSGASRVAKKQLGKDDFLLLLTKQLQNQDPLSPMDNMEFVAQMSSFSTLEQITNMNTSLQNFVSNANQSYKTEAMGYLGMKVTATPASLGETLTGQVTSIRFEEGEAVFTVNDQDVRLEEISKVEFPT
ncbi:MAG TPA: flagellar hook capping FlgD N-terminal domain-containing protein [Candidatus Ozemobacteraceae bacterium]|nr:flagellar hook capping FlgD N-terminal domain-containing protein [Candidatus Ozemobacteraceae bacterium]